MCGSSHWCLQVRCLLSNKQPKQMRLHAGGAARACMTWVIAPPPSAFAVAVTLAPAAAKPVHQLQKDGTAHAGQG